MSVPIPVRQFQSTMIDLDSFDEPMSKKQPEKVQEKHERAKSNLINAIISTIPEEEKDSNFGDYGTESDSETLDESTQLDQATDSLKRSVNLSQQKRTELQIASKDALEEENMKLKSQLQQAEDNKERGQ